MTRKCIGIAGPSGSGKSTLALHLCKSFPHVFSLVHVDDYFVRSEEAPKVGEYINWDDPRAVRFEDMHKNLSALLNGEAVTVRTKSELYYPEYDPQQPQRITHVIQPQEIILLEGYLSLFDSSIRDLMNFKIYLDIPIENSMLRRSANKAVKDRVYLETVLIPASREYVEPTKEFADLVVDVSPKSSDEVYEEILPILKHSFIL